jgi:hypothetical protein
MSAIDIRTMEVLEGDLPIKALDLVKEWLKGFQEELLIMWQTQNFKTLPALE